MVIAIALFAALMTLRYELSSVLARAAVAAFAFVVLGLSVVVSRDGEHEPTTR